MTAPLRQSGRSLASLRGVLLDVGGVMAVPNPVQLARVVSRFGGISDEAGLIRAHYEAMAVADGWSGFEWPVYHHRLLVACGIADNDLQACATAMAEAVATVPDWWSHALAGAADGLRRLSAVAAVGIVSNSDGTVERLLKELGMAQVGQGEGADVRIIVDSAVVGVEKPDAAIFAPAIAALGLPADAIGYVGDTLAYDMSGARAAGLFPIHLDPYALCPDVEDHVHVTGIAEVVDLLRPPRA